MFDLEGEAGGSLVEIEDPGLDGGVEGNEEVGFTGILGNRDALEGREVAREED